MSTITVNTPVHRRRTILIADAETLEKYAGKKQPSKYSPYIKIPILATTFLMPFVGSAIYAGAEILERLNLKDFQIAKGEIDYCAENFNFPPQHPANEVVYTCPDYQSDYYLPIASFHEYTFQLKMSAFMEMCSSLGARNISLIYAEENGKDLNINVGANGIPSQFGKVDFDNKTNANSKSDNAFNLTASFPKPKEIKEFTSKWISTEPTWVSMQRIRLSNGFDETEVEFNYSDEMGIDSSLVAKLNGMGVNIGGKFKEITKRKLKYKVNFWGID